jgi:hypothetical protein
MCVSRGSKEDANRTGEEQRGLMGSGTGPSLGVLDFLSIVVVVLLQQIKFSRRRETPDVHIHTHTRELSSRSGWRCGALLSNRVCMCL